MTLTEAVVVTNQLMESSVIGENSDIETFNKLAFIKQQIISEQTKPRKKKNGKAN